MTFKNFGIVEKENRKKLTNELRKEIDNIRYQWVAPPHLSNETLEHIIKLLRNEYSNVELHKN